MILCWKVLDCPTGGTYLNQRPARSIGESELLSLPVEGHKFCQCRPIQHATYDTPWIRASWFNKRILVVTCSGGAHEGQRIGRGCRIFHWGCHIEDNTLHGDKGSSFSPIYWFTWLYPLGFIHIYLCKCTPTHILEQLNPDFIHMLVYWYKWT